LALADFKYRAHKKTLYSDLGNCDFVDNRLFENRFGAFAREFVAVKMILSVCCAVVLSAYGGYLYGKSRAQTQIVEKQVEVIKYVAQKRAKIQARPNASRAELLELMHKGEL
jgi:hypothetical protein